MFVGSKGLGSCSQKEGFVRRALSQTIHHGFRFLPQKYQPSIPQTPKKAYSSHEKLPKIDTLNYASMGFSTATPTTTQVATLDANSKASLTLELRHIFPNTYPSIVGTDVVSRGRGRLSNRVYRLCHVWRTDPSPNRPFREELFCTLLPFFWQLARHRRHRRPHYSIAYPGSCCASNTGRSSRATAASETVLQTSSGSQQVRGRLAGRRIRREM